MRLFITGAEGYIGTVLWEEFEKRGHEVAGLDTGFYRDAWLYGGKPNHHQIINKDIRHITANDLQGNEAIIHLAELANDPLGEVNPETTYDISYEGTKLLIEACKEAGIKKFLYFSSCGVYGFTDEIVNENSAPNPLTTYTKVKLMNERQLLDAADENFSPIIFRNATVYGPSPRMRFDLAVNSLVGYACTTGEIKMESNGMPWRPFVHILDVIDAAEIALQAPAGTIDKQILNIGPINGNYQIQEIAKLIGDHIPNCKVTLNPSNPDKRSYRVNFDKAHSLLPGFSCKRDIKEGIKELYSIFKKIKLDKETFQSRYYNRLKQIKYLGDTEQVDNKLFWISQSV